MLQRVFVADLDPARLAVAGEAGDPGPTSDAVDAGLPEDAEGAGDGPSGGLGLPEATGHGRLDGVTGTGGGAPRDGGRP
jgi:hypothetical protein